LDSGLTIKDMIEYGFMLGGVIAGIWYMVRKHKDRGDVINPPPPPPKNPIGMERDSRIHDMLVELRTETRADRVQILQFHNGEFYDTNISIKRFSCSHEVIKQGVASSFDSYQGCLLSGYIDGLRVFIESGSPVTKLLYSDLENGLYKSTMINNGVHLHVGIPLKGLVKGEQRIMGILLLSYNDERAVTQCSFDALIDEGVIVDNETCEIAQRVCDGTCDDCRFSKYTTRLETELIKVN